MLAGMGIPIVVVHAARRQGGYLTRSQLIELGMSASAIDRRVASGDFKAVSPATYQIIPSTDHTDLLTGALLALPDAVVSHQSAAHILRFPHLPKLQTTVTVRSHTTHVFPGVIVRRCDDLDHAHLVRVAGLRTTAVVRTAFDLAGVLDFEEAERVVEALVVAGRLKVSQLDRLVEQLARRGKRGTTNARAIVEARSGSDPDGTILERKGRHVLSRHGLPAPVPQYAIPWDRRRRFDDAYPNVLLALEWDSRSWHVQQSAMEADRRRDRQAATHGWLVVRFTWREVTEQPDEVASTVASLLATRPPAS